MPRQIALMLIGDQAHAAAEALARRLTGLGHAAQAAGPEVLFTPRAGAEATPPRRELALDPNDPARFAAEKILDELSARGLVDLDAPQVSEEDEARLEDRLKRLGYIE
jgi:hypothetical protein